MAAMVSAPLVRTARASFLVASSLPVPVRPAMWLDYADVWDHLAGLVRFTVLELEHPRVASGAIIAT